MIKILKKLIPEALKSRAWAALEVQVCRRLARKPYFSRLQKIHETVGIGWRGSNVCDGETFFVTNILPELLQGNEPTVFDVGAHHGDYSKLILKSFGQAKIHCFEPVPTNFERLRRSIKEHNVELNNLAVGSEQAKISIFDYQDHGGSEHASTYRKVLTELHGAGAVVEHLVDVTTLDGYCLQKGVSKIDLLKIDTEGHELKVLEGVSKMLIKKDVGIIQFEFNEMNVFSRVFLKDFYDMLHDLVFYRLHHEGIVPLGAYSAFNEVFRFQNIIAVNPRKHGFEAMSRWHVC